jgi:hypothetical protein
MTVWNQSSEAAFTGRNSAVEEVLNPICPIRARYAIDIRGQCVHAEFDELEQLLAIVDGLGGRANVIDRHSKTLVFQGTTDELRKALGKDFASVAGDSFDVGE